MKKEFCNKMCITGGYFKVSGFLNHMRLELLHLGYNVEDDYDLKFNDTLIDTVEVEFASRRKISKRQVLKISEVYPDIDIWFSYFCTDTGCHGALACENGIPLFNVRESTNKRTGSKKMKKIIKKMNSETHGVSHNLYLSGNDSDKRTIHDILSKKYSQNIDDVQSELETGDLNLLYFLTDLSLKFKGVTFKSDYFDGQYNFMGSFSCANGKVICHTVNYKDVDYVEVIQREED